MKLTLLLVRQINNGLSWIFVSLSQLPVTAFSAFNMLELLRWKEIEPSIVNKHRKKQSSPFIVAKKRDMVVHGIGKEEACRTIYGS